jgi:hypothetical protein
MMIVSGRRTKRGHTLIWIILYAITWPIALLVANFEWPGYKKKKQAKFQTDPLPRTMVKRGT